MFNKGEEGTYFVDFSKKWQLWKWVLVFFYSKLKLTSVRRKKYLNVSEIVDFYC